MAKHMIAYDLGTSGCKASLYDADGLRLASHTVPYETLYPSMGRHEQRPMDWWRAVAESTNKLLAAGRLDKNSIECLAISGHSMAVVPLDKAGRLLRETVPIWSDGRAGKQVADFFRKMDHTEWYRITGNGFRPSCYAVFKMLWYRDNEPDMFRQTHKILGTKDFINLKLTGRFGTDYSYASGAGVYDLLKWDYSDRLIEISGLPREMLPDVGPSTAVVGELTAEAADLLGLPEKVKVISGGVDNSCMAAGARNIKEGRLYTSLGTSAWIAVSSHRPVIGDRVKPFVFTHVLPGMFTSAVSIFSAGSSFNWVRDHLCADLVADGKSDAGDPYAPMESLASQSPVGANRLLFNPSLCGGSTIHRSPHIHGAFIGLDLSHTRADVIRAAMEGIAMDLRLALDAFRDLGVGWEEMLLVGGGSRSKLWRQIFADVYNTNIVKTNIDQDAASLGAAALAAVGAGLWENFTRIDEAHRIEDVTRPLPDHVACYKKLLPIFRSAGDALARLGDQLLQPDS